jgi:hypothetical protein
VKNGGTAERRQIRVAEHSADAGLSFDDIRANSAEISLADEDAAIAFLTFTFD